MTGWPEPLPENRQFWRQQTCPWWPPITGARSMRTAGPPTTFWRGDLLLSECFFLVDILLRVIRSRRRLAGLSWGQALVARCKNKTNRICPCCCRSGPCCGVPCRAVADQWTGQFLKPLQAVVKRVVVVRPCCSGNCSEVLRLQLMDGAQA